MNKFGEFSNPDPDCDDCKENQVYPKEVSVTVKPKNKTFTLNEYDLIEEVLIDTAIQLNKFNFSDPNPITIIKTVNPTLAKFTFQKLIEKGLNASMHYGT